MDFRLLSFLGVYLITRLYVTSAFGNVGIQNRVRLNSASDQLKATIALLGNAPRSSNDLVRTLTELKDAARSIRVLADYLERHPESLLRGKPQEASR